MPAKRAPKADPLVVLVDVDDVAAAAALMQQALDLAKAAKDDGEYSAANAALKTYAAARVRWETLRGDLGKTSKLQSLRTRVEQQDEVGAKRARRQSDADVPGGTARRRARPG